MLKKSMMGIEFYRVEAIAYEAQGHQDLAMNSLTQVIDLAEVYEPDPARKAHDYFIYGKRLGDLGKWNEALDPLRQSQAALLSAGVTDERLGTCLYNLAFSLCMLRRMDEATPLAEEALRIQLKVFSEPHKTIADSRFMLGRLLGSQGDRVRAFKLLRQAEADYRQLGLSRGDEQVQSFVRKFYPSELKQESEGST